MTKSDDGGDFFDDRKEAQGLFLRVRELLAVDTGNVQATMTFWRSSGGTRAQRRGRIQDLRIAMS